MLLSSWYCEFTNCFGYCLNYFCINLFINVWYFVVVNIPWYCTLLPFMVMFAVHLSYGYSAKSCCFIVFEYMSYHNSADSIHPYRALISRTYGEINPFSTRTFFSCLGFTSHMMSKNSPSIFTKMNLYSGMSTLSYAPGTTKSPHLLFCVHQQWVGCTGFPGVFSERIRLL